ncbi:MAG: hypothetical protein C4527_05120 [Candidatus Omnitrophota bacterium]|jgi:Tol biopolymer transport system component|nr:MAG: hypothetical protein C4527_05120 [Candidatus Omnitrophota bacterium]
MDKQIKWGILFIIAGIMMYACSNKQPEPVSKAVDERTIQLQEELADKGWISYSARSENGTWDIYLIRPDGSQKRNLTNSPDFEEAAPHFSPDGAKILYRRIDKGTTIHHDLYGFQGRLIIADADGANPIAFGENDEYPWASWSPDGAHISCLTKKEIQIIDLESKEVVRTLPRQGVYQQLFWSADGQWFTGTGNVGGMQWCVVRMNAETGEVNPVHKFQSCTPDWFADSVHIIFSTRPPHQSPTNEYGWTQLWLADGDGQHPRLIYGEDGFHIYGGEVSPDGKYVLFTKCPKDGGGSEESGAPMCVMRLEDAPTIGGECADLRNVHPDTKDGPVLELLPGWEPCWTYAEIDRSQ